MRPPPKRAASIHQGSCMRSPFGGLANAVIGPIDAKPRVAQVVRFEATPASSRGAVSSDAETELLYSASLSSRAASARPLRGCAERCSNPLGRYLLSGRGLAQPVVETGLTEHRA